MDFFESKSPSPNEMTLEEEIIHLADSFAEFSAINAFVTASMVAVMSLEEAVPDDVLQGAMRCSDSLRSRSREIKVAMDRFREKYCLSESSTFNKGDSR